MFLLSLVFGSLFLFMAGIFQFSSGEILKATFSFHLWKFLLLYFYFFGFFQSLWDCTVFWSSGRVTMLWTGTKTVWNFFSMMGLCNRNYSFLFLRIISYFAICWISVIFGNENFFLAGYLSKSFLDLRSIL